MTTFVSNGGDHPFGDGQSGNLPEDLDTILSNALFKLSVGERNSIDEEFHGVSTLAPKESPELLKSKLLELSDELDLISDDCPLKAAYIESQQYHETYTNTDDFRLRFLRCELFDAKKAATRLIKFLSFASDIFGPELLRRPIRFSDLTKEEVKIFRSGDIQMLPYRDQAGRPVAVWVGGFDIAPHVKTRVRLMLYLFYSLTNDIENQQKGLIKLVWIQSESAVGAPSFADVRGFQRLYDSSPIRDTSNHFCLPDKPAFHLFRAMVGMSHAGNFFRLKFHIGEETELRYKLKNYGLPIQLLPLTGTGNIKTNYHKQWVRLRKTLDEKSAKGEDDDSIIEWPRSTDVVFRTGMSLAYHPGNTMFQSIVLSKTKEHAVASQTRKREITKDIINKVRQNKGRFVQWDTRGWWTELDDASKIHAKVAIAVRDSRKKIAAKYNRQSCHASTSLFQHQDGKRRKIAHDDGFSSDSSSSKDNKCLILK
uniref:DUF6824 domain-containing protein n=1 Tax=Pseudo-nitzschia delicatissima TaxID=44447 RepID=A0A7S0UI21_9STRA|mmetsp:Transcript_4433/g.9274  ORF Transcript_4433/g.9274 Transcript_4433/m.9274 type:complete len:481 (+) Transcript_4433:115-1557(+)